MTGCPGALGHTRWSPHVVTLSGSLSYDDDAAIMMMVFIADDDEEDYDDDDNEEGIYG